MMNIRTTTLGLLMAAALAGCNAAPAPNAPAAASLGQEPQAASQASEGGPEHYSVYAVTNTAVASMSASVNTTTAYRANDNSTSTWWESGAVTKPVFRATMASSYSLYALRVTATANVGAYTIETSADAKTWKVALAGQKNTTTSQYKYLPAGTTGKYIRLTFDNAGKSIRLYELDVYTTNATTTAPTPTPAPVATPTPAPAATPAPTTGVSADQQAVLTLVNAERAKVGAKPLAFTTALNNCATFRSQDMVNRNYFSHTDPDGHDPFYWMKQYGISYTSAGENIAYGQRTPADVMNSWMNSSGHKANILKTSFGHIGIGVVKNSAGTIYWTQMFTN